MTLKEKLEALIRGEKLEYFGGYIFLPDQRLLDESLRHMNLEAIENSKGIYHPPTLNLGPEHVGKRVKLRNGSITIITILTPDHRLFVAASNYDYDKTGKSSKHQDLDIVEVLK